MINDFNYTHKSHSQPLLGSVDLEVKSSLVDVLFVKYS